MMKEGIVRCGSFDLSFSSLVLMEQTAGDNSIFLKMKKEETNSETFSTSEQSVRTQRQLHWMKWTSNCQVNLKN
jgi:hypothetical protein